MGSEAELESPTLPLFSISHIQSNEPSGCVTPFYTPSVSVPFRWEEEPGKPRPCTDLATVPNPTDLSQKKGLELPPRLLLETKLLSPTTVLDGPYVTRSRFQSSSFRMVGGDCYGSFSSDHERSNQLKALVLSKNGGGWFDSLGRRVLKGKREVDYVFPSSVDGESDGGGGGSVGESSSFKMKNTKHRRVGSFSSLSHSRPHFWATIYQGLRQVVPWKSRKSKHDGIVT